MPNASEVPHTGPRSGSVTSRVLAATSGRDRVLDAVKAGALLAVVVGHSLAWHLPSVGAPVNVLDVSPGLVALTWAFQVLPLFFAAGAVANDVSCARRGSREFWRTRARGLLTPVLVYSAVWTGLLLPLSLVVPGAVFAGRFLAVLLWFAGVYLVVVAAVPLTRRQGWRTPRALMAWAGAIVLVDWLRLGMGLGWAGWINLLLVWGWLHQLGYGLPRARRWCERVRGARLTMAFCALLLASAAAAIAWWGPYSMSLVTRGGDPEASNLSPPTVVLALYGAGQICALAALWPWLDRVLNHTRVWVAVAIAGSRGMNIYLWHIPLVGCAAGIAWAADWRVTPLGAAWWAGHGAVVALVLVGAWFLAGAMGRVDRWVGRARTIARLPGPIPAILGGLAVLVTSATGFATWWGRGPLGAPAASWFNLVVVAFAWQGAARRPGMIRRPDD